MNGRRWIPLAAVAALLGLAMLAAVYANPTFERLPPDVAAQNPFNQTAPAPTQEPATDPPTALPDSPALVPPWLGYLLSGLCFAAILAIVGALLWTILRDRLTERKEPLAKETGELPTLAETQQRLRSAVDEGLLDLADEDADPRRAVIACWVRLEEAAAAAGTPRAAGDTSTDLVGRLLADHHISEPVLDGFAAIYREARFATHVVDVSMREQARAALRQVRDELTSVGRSV